MQPETAAPEPLADPKPEPLWPAVGRARQFGFLTVLLVTVFLAYLNSFDTGFPLDNRLLILEDPRMKEPGWEKVRQIFTEDYWWPRASSGLFRPLSTITLYFNYAVLGQGDRPAGYHAVNLVLHLATAAMVYLVGLVLWREPWRAFFTAAVFAVHPVTVESVTNIVGRADLFAGLVVTGGLLVHIQSTRREGLRRLPWLAALMLILLFGAFAKENSIVLCGVIVLYDVLFRLRRPYLANLAGFALRHYAVLLPPLAAMFYVRRRVLTSPMLLPVVDNPAVAADFIAARLTALKVIFRYLRLLVWPQSLSADYSYNQVKVFSWPLNRWEDLECLAAAVVLAALAAALLWQRNREVTFFGGWFFGTLLPMANLLFFTGSIMAERFLYVPAIGFAGVATFLVFRLAGRRAVAILSLAVACLAARTIVRNRDWVSDETLFRAAVRVSPDSFKTHQLLAFSHYRAGLSADNIETVISSAERSLEVLEGLPIEHRSSMSYAHLGAYYRLKGDMLAPRGTGGQLKVNDRARQLYLQSRAVLREGALVDRALRQARRRDDIAFGKPPEQMVAMGNTDIYNGLAQTCQKLGLYDEAIEAAREHRRLQPLTSDAYVNLANAFYSSGRKMEAIRSAHQALSFTPGNVGAPIKARLFGWYHEAAPESCAIVKSGSDMRLDTSCPLVRENLCGGHQELYVLLRQTGRVRESENLRGQAAKSFGCHLGPDGWR